MDITTVYLDERSAPLLHLPDIGAAFPDDHPGSSVGHDDLVEGELEDYPEED